MEITRIETEKLKRKTASKVWGYEAPYV